MTLSFKNTLFDIKNNCIRTGLYSYSYQESTGSLEGVAKGFPGNPFLERTCHLETRAAFGMQLVVSFPMYMWRDEYGEPFPQVTNRCNSIQITFP
jgi:hypothetical protein